MYSVEVHAADLEKRKKCNIVLTGVVSIDSKMQRLLADWFILYLYIQENKKAASSAEKDQKNSTESDSASNENRRQNDPLCKSERSTWQKVQPRSQRSRAQGEGIINHEC